jgi:hypothetical protein
MKRLCEDLNKRVCVGIWYDTFTVRNTKWLCLVNDIGLAVNSDKVLCGVVGYVFRLCIWCPQSDGGN